MNWDWVGGRTKTWPDWRKPTTVSPTLTGTAVSARPAAQVTVVARCVARRESLCTVRKNAAHERLRPAMIEQKEFSARLPWYGSCQESTGRKVKGSPMASLKARSYSRYSLDCDRT